MTIPSVDLTPRIGSELKLDKAALLSGEHADDIRALLVARGALVARGLFLSDEELRTVARTLGDLRIGASKRGTDGKTLNEGEEGVLKVSLDPKVNPDYARFLPGNHLWHMDGTYEEIPPFATLFTPYRLSEQGGDTMFASTYAAFEDLPADEQARLETLRVVHSMQAALFPVMRDCTPEEFAVWYSYPQRSHPLVWQHKSGRKSLVLSTSAAYVEGMHPAESHDLLERLMIHATQDKYVYRHKWQLGDLAMWDNTGAMHRAMPFEANSKREFHRCTLNGEEPVTAPERMAEAAA
ncbi:TauD/TfdA dioxygenase family protein [Novosphingobium mangrovi (ex Huang et al. 2023)]|uniref:TauD/TfdA family dioxygenase n=1 Tax=Novosphingobium mangrovi (ex Huang et al. 2023) TaxID=2976432 RepID=A0ABT2HZI8_9SPHN|nr:TauD/TfdA family dioxygenase [Novosphingobium mangrovi (ex Huang et al. 2023)]MCT2397968.1 TauD/TfdA family dioxygenase [Novosphingobium mangrovi (ex Huang et al. 2023)]